MMQREHPITILKYSTKSLWLLIFPLLRGIRSIRVDISAFYYWIHGVWFDLLVLFFILLFGFLHWRSTGFQADQHDFRYQSGILFRRTTVIPLRNLAVVAVEQPTWLRPFLAFRIQFNTRAGSVKSPDLKLLIRRSDYRTLKQVLQIPRLSPDTMQKYLPRWWNIVLFSFLFSSSLSGVIYVATFFFQSGRTLEELLETSLTKEFTNVTAEVTQEVSGTLSPYIHYIGSVPPVIISIGIILLAAWLLSFLRNIIRYIGFRCELNQAQMQIRTGFITRRRYLIYRNKIDYVDLRQNLLMKLCRVMSVNLSCAGYGYTQAELPVLIPFVTARQLQRLNMNLFPQPVTKRNQYQPSRRGFLRYLFRPLLLSAAEPVLIYALMQQLPAMHNFLSFFLLMLELPTVWFLFVRLAALLTSGVVLENTTLSIRYCRGFGFHTVIADVSAIAKIQTQISPIQRFSKRCDLSICLHNERARPHIVAGMLQTDVEQLLTQLDEIQKNNAHR